METNSETDDEEDLAANIAITDNDSGDDELKVEMVSAPLANDCYTWQTPTDEVSGACSSCGNRLDDEDIVVGAKEDDASDPKTFKQNETNVV